MGGWVHVRVRDVFTMMFCDDDLTSSSVQS